MTDRDGGDPTRWARKSDAKNFLKVAEMEALMDIFNQLTIDESPPELLSQRQFTPILKQIFEGEVLCQ